MSNRVKRLITSVFEIEFSKCLATFKMVRFRFDLRDFRYLTVILDCDYGHGSRVHKEYESICDVSHDFISSFQDIMARDVSVRNVTWNGSPVPRESSASLCPHGSRSPSSRAFQTTRRHGRTTAHLSGSRATKKPLDFDVPQQTRARRQSSCDPKATARLPVARYLPSVQPVPPPALPLSWESLAIPVFPDIARPLCPYDLPSEQPLYDRLCAERSALPPAPESYTHISRSPALPAHVTPTAPFRSDVVERGPLAPPSSHICIPQVDKQTLRRLSTSYHKGPKGANLFVYYLPSYISSEDLALLFFTFGCLLSARVFIDEVTKEHKGFGFVSYSTVEDAENAIRWMNGARIGSKRLKVEVKKDTSRYVRGETQM